MVQLIIKNPHMGPEHQSFSLQAAGSMTVKELKEQLTESYPTRPASSAQTLIHGGRVVRDEKKLDEVISKHHDDGPKMFHLIIKQMQNDAAMKRESTAPKVSSERRQQTDPASTRPTPAPAPAAEASAPQGSPASSLPTTTLPTPPAALQGSPAPPEYNAEFAAQMAAADAQAQYFAQQVAMAQAHAHQAAYAAQYYGQQAALSGMSPGLSPTMSPEQAAQLGPGGSLQQYPGSPYGMQSPQMMGYPSPQEQMGYPLSPQQQMGYPASPQQYPASPQQYPASPQQYPSSPQQYPSSPQDMAAAAAAAGFTPYNSPWAYNPAATANPPAFSLDQPAATHYANTHSASMAAANSGGTVAAAVAASAAEVAAVAANASSPILAAVAAAATETTAGSELRQRGGHTFAEEEESLRGDHQDAAATPGPAPATAEQARPAAEEDNDAVAALAAARAADEAEAIDPMLGEGADDNGVRGQLYFIFKVLFLLFMFFGDGESYRGEDDGADGGSGVQGLDLDSLEAQRMLKIFGIATLCYLMAFGYLDVFGRLVFGANGLPRPLMRRDVVATPAPAQPRDPAVRDDADGAGEEGADAAAAGDGAQDVVTDPRTQSQDAPNPVAVPEERPPLTFMGNVGNIALAFVTSLLPSWEG